MILNGNKHEIKESEIQCFRLNCNKIRTISPSANLCILKEYFVYENDVIVKMPLYIFSMKNTRLDIYIFDKHSMGKCHARKLRLILTI